MPMTSVGKWIIIQSWSVERRYLQVFMGVEFGLKIDQCEKSEIQQLCFETSCSRLNSGPFLDEFKFVSETKSKSKLKSWLILLVSTCVSFCCWQRSDSATSGVILPSTKSSSNHSSNPSSPPPQPAKYPEKNIKLVVITKNDSKLTKL